MHSEHLRRAEEATRRGASESAAVGRGASGEKDTGLVRTTDKLYNAKVKPYGLRSGTRRSRQPKLECRGNSSYRAPRSGRRGHYVSRPQPASRRTKAASRDLHMCCQRQQAHAGSVHCRGPAPPAVVSCHPKPSRAVRWHPSEERATRHRAKWRRATIGSDGKEQDGLGPPSFWSRRGR